MVFWIIIALLAIVWIGAIVFGIIDDYLGEGIYAAIVVSFVGVILCFPLGYFATNPPNPATDPLVSMQIVKLKALSTSSGMEGEFFLGSGSVSGVQKFSYFQKNKDGSFELKSTDADMAKIFEEKSGEPYVEITTRKTEPKKFLSTWPTTTYETFTFYIPEGSVIENYQVEAD